MEPHMPAPLAKSPITALDDGAMRRPRPAIMDHIGELVQLRAKAGCRQIPGARLIAVEGGKAIVRPPGHKKNEIVPIEDVRPWKKGAALSPKARVRAEIATVGIIDLAAAPSMVQDANSGKWLGMVAQQGR